MRLRLELLRQYAIEGRRRILQDRRAGRPASPLPEREAVVAVDALLAAECECEQRMVLMQEVDGEGAFLTDARMRAGIAVDADD